MSTISIKTCTKYIIIKKENKRINSHYYKVKLSNKTNISALYEKNQSIIQITAP